MRGSRRAGFLKVFAAVALTIVCLPSARANLTIIPTYDTSITSDPNAGTIETGIQAAINVVQANIANNLTVTIQYSETTSGLASTSASTGNVSLTDYKLALAQQHLSANDVVADSTLPATSGSGILLTRPLLRALGFAAGSAGGFDGFTALNTSIMNLTRTSVNPAKSDLQEAVEHEIDEVLGIGGKGSELGSGIPLEVGPLDFYRYSSPGTRSFDTSSSIAPYFSIDGGTTDLVHFNQAFGADYGDWGNGKIPADLNGNTPPQVQDAFSTLGQFSDIGPNERIALDVVGYDLPEPTSFGLMALGAVTVLGMRRKHSRR